MNKTKIPFRTLVGKSIVGNMGSIIGTVTDVVMDENTGKIISLDVEPSEQSPIPPSDDCYRLIPYKIVLAIRDVVVIDESKINKVRIISKRPNAE
ncbi:PRC-barrel domain-containing protein [Methanothermococcus okinawensis]|uniref:PRC-barrel domain protein n=1 Tax=Methanothermococcus okinawensis (strain DSM 14208 / JCM 11175 / IH1) TaxID=647113 RepID=F8AN03_METOI|nr:PRC-barrel domain protein [Methanothermococcus okinawensis IH1]